MDIVLQHFFSLFILSLAVICSFSQPAVLPSPAYQFKLEQHVYRDEIGDRRRLQNTSAPLFEGIGTHYSFIWVGSPPQRVSVIMDTGSHHTAFPCVGCNCGPRIDPFFDPKKSNTSVVKKCGLNSAKCYFRQSYSEGSSWHAYKVIDKVYIGGEKQQDIISAPNLSVNFEFGCQESETGLFRTQKVGGIMGLSAAEETLPFHLFKHKLAASRMFSLCFKIGGGSLALGGVDQSLHYYTPIGDTKQQSSSIEFVKVLKRRGWFTVKLLDILMYNPSEKTTTTIGGPIFKCNAGRGSIVDSGTTDTYLPSALFSNFAQMFKSISGQKYKNEPLSLSKEQYAKLPTIVYRIEAMEAGKYVEISVHPSSYVEKQASGKFVPRVYLTEGTGAVLGANFMDRHNVIFDVDNMRVGFVKSDCTYSSQSSSSSSSSKQRL